tara:strand:- start:1442 stop:2908 length:1467 start_codon:yes stop_codon:yes gene_type:complete
MSISTSTFVYDGLTVQQNVNTVTGETKIFTADGSTQLAVGSGQDWTITNEKEFLSQYNSIPGNSKTSLSFERDFQNDTATFNEARTDVLNTENVNNTAAQQTLFENGIPGSQDPTTGNYINNDGSVTSTNPFSNDPAAVVSADPTNTATPTGTGTDPDASNNNSVTGGADGVVPIAVEPYNDASDSSATTGQAGGTTTTGGTQEVLRYPLEMPDSSSGFEYDYISIQAAEYSPTGLSPQTGDLSNVNVGTERFETVILPMQPNLEESNSVNYGEDSANFIQLAGGKFAADAINSIGGGDIGALGQAFVDAGTTAKNLMNDPKTKSFISAYFAGQAVGTNLVGRTTGMVVNPNLTVLFTGPKLRQFSFAFPLTPRSEAEAVRIRKIIRSFKRNSLPQRSSSSAFLKSPRIFLLKYIFKSNSTAGTQHPFLNKFKPCMLDSFNVKYTPDNSYMTLRDGSMTRYEITLTFKEVVPNYADEYNDIEEQNMGF